MSANQLAMKPALVNDLPSREGYKYNAFYTKVEKNHFYMVGDNRDHSNDSRFWGSVSYDLIIGQPWFVYFSWDDNYKIRWNRIFRSVESIQYDKGLYQ